MSSNGMVTQSAGLEAIQGGHFFAVPNEAPMRSALGGNEKTGDILLRRILGAGTWLRPLPALNADVMRGYSAAAWDQVFNQSSSPSAGFEADYLGTYTSGAVAYTYSGTPPPLNGVYSASFSETLDGDYSPYASFVNPGNGEIPIDAYHFTSANFKELWADSSGGDESSGWEYTVSASGTALTMTHHVWNVPFETDYTKTITYALSGFIQASSQTATIGNSTMGQAWPDVALFTGRFGSLQTTSDNAFDQQGIGGYSAAMNWTGTGSATLSSSTAAGFQGWWFTWGSDEPSRTLSYSVSRLQFINLTAEWIPFVIIHVVNISSVSDLAAGLGNPDARTTNQSTENPNWVGQTVLRCSGELVSQGYLGTGFTIGDQADIAVSTVMSAPTGATQAEGHYIAVGDAARTILANLSNWTGDWYTHYV